MSQSCICTPALRLSARLWWHLDTFSRPRPPLTCEALLFVFLSLVYVWGCGDVARAFYPLSLSRAERQALWQTGGILTQMDTFCALAGLEKKILPLPL